MKIKLSPATKIAIVLLPVVVLVGCATRGFVKQGATYKDFYQDLRECEKENSPNWSWCVGAMCDHQKSELAKRRNQCMLARDWELSRAEEAFRP